MQVTVTTDDGWGVMAISSVSEEELLEARRDNNLANALLNRIFEGI